MSELFANPNPIIVRADELRRKKLSLSGDEQLAAAEAAIQAAEALMAESPIDLSPTLPKKEKRRPTFAPGISTWSGGGDSGDGGSPSVAAKPREKNERRRKP